MERAREDVCQGVAQRLRAAAGQLSSMPALVGFDGFVDEIIDVVDKRHDDDHYEPVPTIADLARKIASAAGESCNYELVVKKRKLGGNGPIMANALACLGLGVTYVGNLGYPSLDPVFEPFAARAHVVSIADPGTTDALEFADGKLMMSKYTSMGEVSWENLIARVGPERWRGMLQGATLVGLVNWTMIPHMSAIWQKLLEERLPNREGQRRTLFIDLADPEKRTPEDIRLALALLTKLQLQVDVVFGMNMKEAIEVAGVLGLPAAGDTGRAAEETAAAIRERLQVECVVVHPRSSAAAATASGCVRFAGPFVRQPLISTGAGDHFNAGFCLGWMLGMELDECLCTGVSASGYYVRSALSPSALELAHFAAELPDPE